MTRVAEGQGIPVDREPGRHRRPGCAMDAEDSGVRVDPFRKPIPRAGVGAWRSATHARLPREPVTPRRDMPEPREREVRDVDEGGGLSGEFEQLQA